jgi:aminomethyltransferase
MQTLLATPLKDRHEALGAKMVEFGGWWMPIQYREGIVAEHLAARRAAGLFDVSHMGRFVFRGPDALPLLQRALTNDASALPVGRAQYTMIPDEDGGAVDDAYLYRFDAEGFVLVVNAANREKDLRHLRRLAAAFPAADFADESDATAMLALQGPTSEANLGGLVTAGSLPPPSRNATAQIEVAGVPCRAARTGYTGEPSCFELICPAASAVGLWDRLLAAGAVPVGLGARDTLRLEAGLPLYGHELGADADGVAIPIFACPLARFGVSFAAAKGDFVGRAALERQREALDALARGDDSGKAVLPRLVRPLALLERGVARAGAPVLHRGAPAGRVTSGTMVPYWVPGADGAPRFEAHALRGLALALVDSRLREGDEMEVEVRGNRLPARIARRFLDSRAAPFARPIL